MFKTLVLFSVDHVGLNKICSFLSRNEIKMITVTPLVYVVSQSLNNQYVSFDVHNKQVPSNILSHLFSLFEYLPASTCPLGTVPV